jgi:membrane protein YdbS with pleckstrin-like domain
MLAMVGLRVFDVCTPLWAVIIVAALGLFKEFVIDELIRKRSWDWKDLMMDAIGIGFGFLFTAGYYKMMGIW